MPANPVKIYNYLRAVQYDGTNSADINTLIGGGLTTVSESGGVWSFTSCGNSWTVGSGDWIRYSSGCVTQVYTSAQLAAEYLIAG